MEHGHRSIFLSINLVKLHMLHKSVDHSKIVIPDKQRQKKFQASLTIIIF